MTKIPREKPDTPDSTTSDVGQVVNDQISASNEDDVERELQKQRLDEVIAMLEDELCH